MDILPLEMLQLGAVVATKAEAIQMAGELLVKGKCVEPAYVKGLLARKETMSTFWGNGVSIPHGQFDDMALVHKTGISVLQLPQGVEWDPGEMTYLLIGIAASSDEHVGVCRPGWPK